MTPTTAGSLDTERVVVAAEGFVDRHGLAALSLSALAAELGVSQPAMYRHVDGIDHLLRLVAVRVRAQLRDEIRDAAVGRSGSDAVHAVAYAWRDYVRAHPHRYTATDLTQLHHDEANEEAVEAIIDVLAATLDPSDPGSRTARRNAWVLRSAMHGFGALEVAGGNPRNLDLDALFDHLVDTLLAGFRHHQRADG